MLFRSSDAAACSLVDPRTTELETVTTVGTRVRSLAPTRLEPGHGLAGLALQERRPARTDDYFADARFTRPPAVAEWARAEGVVGMITVPVTDAAGELIALLWAFNRAPRPFTGRDEATLAHLARQAALAMENARLVSDLRHTLDDLKAAQRFRMDARVADGHRRGGGQGLGERHLGGRELAASPRHAREDPDHPVGEDDRHTEQGGEALGREPGAILEPRILLHVGQDERAPVGEDPAHQRGLGGHLLLGGQRRPDAALVRGEVQRPARLVQQPDARHVRLEPRAGHVGEAVEDLGEIERGGEQPIRLGENVQLLRTRIIHRIDRL